MKDEYTSNSYEELCKLLDEINKNLGSELHEAYDADNSKGKKKARFCYDDSIRFEKPLEVVDKYNIGECVLIFGINPS